METKNKENGNELPGAGEENSKPISIDDVIKILVEDEMLHEVEKLYGVEYGVDIEPRGREIYFLLKKIKKDNPDIIEKAEKEKAKIYGGSFSHTEKWYIEWNILKERLGVKA